MVPSLRELYKQGFYLADRAVREDNAKNRSTAKALYEEAAQIVLQILLEETDSKKIALLHVKWDEYTQRAEEIARTLSVPSLSHLREAGDEVAKPGTLSGTSQASSKPPATRHNMLSLDRTWTSAPSVASARNIETNVAGVEASNILTSAEVAVLRKSSIVNGKIYLPWNEQDDCNADDRDSPFMDPDGFLALSAKQKALLAGWKRASELVDITMIRKVNPSSIVQDVVTDCSVVASLCVCSEYEQRFRKPLVTSRIYPQGYDGLPRCSSTGRYTMKLIWNGISRQVVVDDFLPVGREGQLLCTYSMNAELWPSIVEKAYLKVWGGYGFPGSNSGIDLHAMTGWIPEHLLIGDAAFNRADVFQRLRDAHASGNAMITIATGSLKQAGADAGRLGLIADHAYAVLDMRERPGQRECPQRLMKLRNPWRSTHVNAPPSDLPSSASTSFLSQTGDKIQKPSVNSTNQENGIFWMNFEEVCQRFDTIHVSWNPLMWTCRHTLHGSWSLMGPKKDVFNLGSNPQYSLHVDVQSEKVTAVWILLTKHVTLTAENTDFITAHVYGNTGGERVFYSDSPMIRGVHVNNPHVLIKFNSPVGIASYTIVLSQHERAQRALQYSLTVYGMSPFRIEPIVDIYPFSMQIVGQWTLDTAGGSLNFSTWQSNPRYNIHLDEPSSLIVTLEAPKEYAVNLKLIRGHEKLVALSEDRIVLSSGSYRKGFCYLKAQSVLAGGYALVPSTFQPSQVGSFIVSIQAGNVIHILA